VNENGKRDPEEASESLLINECQLLLAEKRTSLSVMRTGIAVYALPLSVLSVLIATSRYYDLRQVLPLMVPLLVLAGGLAVLGTYLVTRAVFRIRHHDRLIHQIKEKHGRLARFLD